MAAGAGDDGVAGADADATAERVDGLDAQSADTSSEQLALTTPTASTTTMTILWRATTLARTSAPALAPCGRPTPH
jgi:hypothetical protein